MTSNHHAPYDLGYTRCTMDRTKGCETARFSQSHKSVLSSDRSLQLDCVKLESLVIADQHAAVNTFPGLAHRPSHHEFATPEVGEVTFMEPAAEGGADDWGEVVTR